MRCFGHKLDDVARRLADALPLFGHGQQVLLAQFSVDEGVKDWVDC